MVPLGDGQPERKIVRVADVTNAEINRELQVLKRIFSLAMKSGRLASRPHIALLRESAPRSGFFDKAEVASVMAHLPAPLQPVIEFAFITGWRLQSEILPLEWRQVDFDAGVIRLDAGMTKNGEPRTFPMTSELRALLQARQTEHTKLKRAGLITPLVFFRMVGGRPWREEEASADHVDHEGVEDCLHCRRVPRSHPARLAAQRRPHVRPGRPL